jgi:hypothetical protein
MSKPINTDEVTRKKFGSRWYRRIQPSQLEPGDIVEFHDKNNMFRCRRVATIAKRRSTPYGRGFRRVDEAQGGLSSLTRWFLPPNPFFGEQKAP